MDVALYLGGYPSSLSCISARNQMSHYTAVRSRWLYVVVLDGLKAVCEGVCQVDYVFSTSSVLR